MSEMNRIVSTLAGFHLAALDENKPEHAASIKKAMDILEALEDYDVFLERLNIIDAIWAYYIGARGVGHTELMLDGVLNYDAPMAVVVASHREAGKLDVLSKADRMIVPYDQFDKLVGMRLPLAWDNAAIVRIFSSLSMIQSTFRIIKTIANGDSKKQEKD